MPNAGDQIGPYTLISRLGKGAFGVVWLSERRTSIATTKAALKIPHDDNIELDIIRQEANVWAEASGHPNVLPIIEANVYDGIVVIASEFAPDGSLENRIEADSQNAPKIETSVEIVLGILAGLEHLHSRRIIHRDLKPANIMFQGETPRLTDFGVSRVLKSTKHSSTTAGTPIYMAPEAFDGERSQQTDIWAVGVILYQLICGRLPFEYEDMTSLWAAIALKEIRPMPEAIPESLRRIAVRSLSKDKVERYATATEMRLDLRKEIGLGLFESSTSEAVTIEALPKHLVPDTLENRKTRKGIRFVAALVVITAIVASLVGGYYLYGQYLGSASENRINSQASSVETDSGIDLSSNIYPSQWRGRWNSPRGSVYLAEVTFDPIASENTVVGKIDWQLESSPVAGLLGKLGREATEFVRGKYNPITRMLEMEGYREFDPDDIITPDKYRLIFAEDGRSLTGFTWNQSEWTAGFSLTRTVRDPDNSTTQIEGSKEICEGTVGFWVIGKGSPNLNVTVAESRSQKLKGIENACVVNSSKWSNLNSSWYVVVYGSYADEKAANNMKKQLEKEGLAGLYIKFSGSSQPGK